MPFLLPDEQRQSIESKDRQPNNLRLFVFANTKLKHMVTVRNFYKNIYTMTKLEKTYYIVSIFISLALSRSGLVPPKLNCCNYRHRFIRRMVPFLLLLSTVTQHGGDLEVFSQIQKITYWISYFLEMSNDTWGNRFCTLYLTTVPSYYCYRTYQNHNS